MSMTPMAYALPLPKAKPALAKMEMSTCSLMLKGAGLRLHSPPPSSADAAARQHAGHEVADGERRHLHRDLRHDERLRPVGEELVEEAHERARHQPDAPHPERPHRQVRVVRRRHRQPHLLDRRLLLHLFLPALVRGHLTHSAWDGLIMPSSPCAARAPFLQSERALCEVYID
jgi:hypothetical protein